MANTMNVLLAGFGGQGILFTGKVMVYGALTEGKELSWLPSYGPEMRGGTCNCSVVISDEAIGSPLVTNPDVLIAMNRPSLEKFVNAVVPGGMILVDSSMVDIKVERDDVKVFYIDATKIADENNMKSCAIIILIGKMFKEIDYLNQDIVNDAVKKVIPAKKAAMIDLNLKAIEIGLNS